MDSVQSLSRLWQFAKLPYRIARWHPFRGGWFSTYCRDHRPFVRAQVGAAEAIDVIVSIVDHFEPSERRGDAAAVESVAEWCQKYTSIADTFRDSDGVPPQHTWFYRAEYPNAECLRVLARECFNGFGEIEFHLHHGFDSHESFARKLSDGLEFFNAAGAMLTTDVQPQRRFAYIAGNWALDNGVGDDSKSGCNTELIALRNAGCYADFTFPAMGSYAQPQKANAIYYATDGPEPKSYNDGTDVEVGRHPTGDLLIFQGPLVFDWSTAWFEDSAVESFAPPAASRLRNWLRANIHVKGKPEWVFVKLHCHGMQSKGVFSSAALASTFEAMTKEWMTPPFRLHFVNAREAYNIAKAAEAEMSGNPGDYRDFSVAPPANKRVRCDQPWSLLSYSNDVVSVGLDGGTVARLEFAHDTLLSVEGKLSYVEYCRTQGVRGSLHVKGDGMITVRTHGGIADMCGSGTLRC